MIDWMRKRWRGWRELTRSCCGRFSTAARKRKAISEKMQNEHKQLIVFSYLAFTRRT